MLHGAGLFSYIDPKNHSNVGKFMVINVDLPSGEEKNSLLVKITIFMFGESTN